MSDKNEVLKETYIPPQMQDDCYISTDGLIFSPEYDKDGKQVKTAIQAHDEWLKGKSQTMPPTTEERLAASEQQLTDMQIALAEAYEYSDTQNTNTQMALVEVYELLATSMEGGVSDG